jgi:tetratricopeptide (TPR) repeat protein
MASLETLAEALTDRYSVEREIGHGGMATVYLAHDRKHQRSVALKVLRPDLAAALGPDRFQREIEIAARLNHPHILPLYDSGEAAGSLFYVMPFVEGETLRARLDREKQLPIGEAVRIAREIADGLAHAHDAGVIHRDIKPENIMLSGGHAVIADFGIARAVSAAEHHNLTGTGIAIGTPAYMSPEQAMGATDLDARSDLYSLACVLFEMLAGEPPHHGPTAQVMIARRVNEAVPSVRATRETISPALDAQLRQALAKLPADRHATAAEFAEALGGVPTGPDWVAQQTGLLRVMGLYFLSSFAMLGLVQVMVTQLGLPDWLVPVAVVLLLVGAPIILGTALLQRGAISMPRPAIRLLTWRRAILGGAMAFGALGLLASGWVLLRDPSRPLVLTRLAVLPFSVRGDTELDYLGEGIVDLLARNLDGAGDLRTVDPGTVLSALGSTRGGTAADAQRYRAVARRVGAGTYLFGSIHVVGGRLRIQASLYDATTQESGDAISQLEVEGDAADPLSLIDELAKRLLVDRGSAQNRLFETATLTTQSLTALKSYLTAEQVLRSGPGRIDSALAGLQRAVAEDSTFALAWYRLAVAAGWQGRHEMASSATAAAVRHSARLADRDRRLLQAYDQYRSGSVDQAEQAFRSLVRDYPDDLESEFQLADLLNWYNPIRGRSQAEARELFDRVLAYDPGFL